MRSYRLLTAQTVNPLTTYVHEALNTTRVTLKTDESHMTSNTSEPITGLHTC